MEKIEAFKIELKALLEKYNATIWCDLDGDTHCLNTSMKVEIDKKDFMLNECYTYIDKYI